MNSHGGSLNPQEEAPPSADTNVSHFLSPGKAGASTGSQLSHWVLAPQGACPALVYVLCQNFLVKPPR